MTAHVSAAPPTRCADVNRASAFGRSRAIIAGHSVLCANGDDDACPMRTDTPPARPSTLRDALAAMNATLAAGKVSSWK